MYASSLPRFLKADVRLPDNQNACWEGVAVSLAESAVGWNWQQWAHRRTRSPALVFDDDTGIPFCRTSKMARLEAVLFISPEAISARKLTQLAMLADVAEANTLIDALNEAYDACDTAFRIERVAAGVQLLTRPVFSRWLNRLHQRQAELKLSSPALETLSIVAYRQPITRADIESVRGVQCAEMLKQLMERGLVRIGGEDSSLGRPYLYETTRKFLEIFGLRSLNELPMADTLRQRSSDVQAAQSAATPDEAPAPDEVTEADGSEMAIEGDLGDTDSAGQEAA